MSYAIASEGDVALAAEPTWPASTADSTAALLERVKRRDASALKTLYELYARRVRSYALQLLRDPDAAQDVAHDVFLRVWRYAASYDASRSLKPEAWIFQIARNLSLNEIAARSRTVSVEAEEHADDDDAGYGDDGPPSQDTMIDRVSSRSPALRRSVDALPSNYRQVVFLRFQQDLSNPEIAEHLQVPLGTVKTWLRRSLIQMRADLGVTPLVTSE